ncbi:hypothetical protein KP004_06330 [Geomonas oryzisoli]|uniref:Uncharacterized protein n=1 Tax=Geomonas oryzisoli TaxID=2847992 RepID=A0ABX8J9V8_9BACT|nr:hypothetical protein [Geomonas oryzisoli]QWV94791.1 hypothetical protein KP004_06330 [Geomonas oryzisoli]
MNLHGLATPLLFGAIVVSALVMNLHTAAWATPPATASCDQGDAYDKLKCKHDGVANQIEFMTGLFKEGTLLGDKLTAGQRGQMTGVKMKTDRSKHKNGANDFKKLAKSEAKSNKNACYHVPLTAQDDGNGDGICDYDQGNPNAKCAAIDLDDNKNKQACNPLKKNKGKGQDGLECDQICSPDEALTDSERSEMEAEAAPIGQAYDALEGELHKVNGDLEELNNAAPQALVSLSAQAVPSGCETPVTTPGLDLAAGILRQVSVTARGVAGMAGTGCKQIAVALGFGGNGSVVCLVFETAASVLEIAYTTVDEILKTEESALQSSTLTCLQKTAGSIDDGFATLYTQHADIKRNDDNNAASIKNNSNANTAALMERINQLRNELVTIMNTPQGQRTLFPVK